MKRTAVGRGARCSATALVIALSTLVVAPARAAERNADDQRAADRLAAMARFLAKAPKLRVTIDYAYDTVQDDGQKIEFGATKVVTVRRPDRLRTETTRRDGQRRAVIFDGTQVAVFDLDAQVYATAPAPGTIDAAVDHFVQDLGMRLPLGQLFSSDLPEQLEDMQRIRRVAADTIAGVATDHVAARGETADIEVWIASSGDPLPQRLVITYRTADERPQFRASFTQWSLAPDVPDSLFSFVPDEGAERIPIVVPRGAGRPAPESGR